MPLISGGKVIEGSRPKYRNNAQGGFGGMGPYSSPGVPASGFLNAVAPPGAVVINLATGVQYVNTGTLAATVWTAAGSVV